MRNFNLRFPGGKPKCLTLSYDDGVDTDIRLAELMKQYGVAGTFNINTGLYAKSAVIPEGRMHRRLTFEEAVALFKDEPLFEVATHGFNHEWPNELPPAAETYAIIEDRRRIEEQYGVICRGHAYPNGGFDDAAVAALKSCGIAYARTTRATYNFKLPTDWLRLDPTCHHASDKLPELTAKFVGDSVSHKPYFFYLWGHSYEFRGGDNWDIIERFFDKAAGLPDVWYCTNIEAYDYVQAWNSLIISVDGRTVHNPTATELWFREDKEVYSVRAGETVRL